MKTILIAYAAAALAFLAVDAVWLSTMANLLYRPLLGDMLAPQFALAPAVAFYVIYIGGIVFFAIRPALVTGRLATAALHGAALGFVAYGTYDLTNHATLRDWPLIITVADMIWGTLLTASASVAGFAAARRFG
ncbi:hypothetical protein IP69_19000 [Bosea sp. AAP35]|uniref:DUF2177 family protein n=1 Tax=Bosea sp. AAP35 TaxID=1523417 RepID=UPI0006B95FE9|nr:DUF2177 family protein [Bosea sp. AAP35]KPF63465.1 hypothetical protein IP69_19000 [Bosea sp. AAP35]